MSDIVITDLINATWEDARREVDTGRKAQLERDAAALEDVWRRSSYALAPTREQFQAALGNTTLNISDTLSALASGQRQVDERVGEMHRYVQENNTLFSTFFETFTPQFAAFQAEARAAWEVSARGLGKLERENKHHGVQIKALAKDIAAIKVVIAARPAERAADQDRLDMRLASMERRLAALEARG